MKTAGIDKVIRVLYLLLVNGTSPIRQPASINFKNIRVSFNVILFKFSLIRSHLCPTSNNSNTIISAVHIIAITVNTSAGFSLLCVMLFLLSLKIFTAFR